MARKKQGDKKAGGGKSTVSFNQTKTWDKQVIKRTLDPEEVHFYLENNLDVTELYDKLKPPKMPQRMYQERYYQKKKNGKENM